MPTATLRPKTDNKNQPLTINLNAPKVINVVPTDASSLQDAFNGNTKYLDVNIAKIAAKISELLNRQGPQFANAPLTLQVQVGQEAFVDYQQLADTLKAKTTDVASGLVTVKFAIKDPQANSQQWQIAPGGEAELTLISDQRIKIFVNDQGIFNDLQSNKTTLNGDNTNFTINWANG